MYLIMMMSVTDLESMTNVAYNYIKNHMLRFNPVKTECVIFGNCTLSPRPERCKTP